MINNINSVKFFGGVYTPSPRATSSSAFAFVCA